ncbi:MAG: zf-HC2 domain-containing protein [Pyrinomonadaceae bacterium]|nr:zf-HC2 domain-containing protein [Pyrinomonadaceae bacterium]
MNSFSKNIEVGCPRGEVLDYLDGELSPADEFDLELHFKDCKICRDEVNAQKKVSTTLEIMLEEESKEIEVPVDFSKVIAARAESNVSGLRQPRERSKALYICAVLFFLVVIGLGTELNSVLGAFERSAEQFAAVGGFIFHLVFDLANGVSIILRNLSHRFVFGSVISLGLIVAFFIFTSLALSRIVLRYNRA